MLQSETSRKQQGAAENWLCNFNSSLGHLVREAPARYQGYQLAESDGFLLVKHKTKTQIMRSCEKSASARIRRFTYCLGQISTWIGLFGEAKFPTQTQLTGMVLNCADLLCHFLQWFTQMHLSIWEG